MVHLGQGVEGEDQRREQHAAQLRPGPKDRGPGDQKQHPEDRSAHHERQEAHGGQLLEERDGRQAGQRVVREAPLLLLRVAVLDKGLDLQVPLAAHVVPVMLAARVRGQLRWDRP